MMTSSKENDVIKNLTMEFWSPIVGDLFTIVTNLYKLSIKGITGGGGIRPPHDYEGQIYPMSNRVNPINHGLFRSFVVMGGGTKCPPSFFSVLLMLHT